MCDITNMYSTLCSERINPRAAPLDLFVIGLNTVDTMFIINADGFSLLLDCYCLILSQDRII